MRPLLLLFLAGGCHPTVPPVAPMPRDAIPAPLLSRPFEAPKTTSATLSNGLRVVVAEDHEVPLAWVRIGFRDGALADPTGREGLAAVTLDMLNEGAGSYDAPGLSAALMRLGSDLGTTAGDDGASVWVSGLSRNLDPTLDLLAAVLLSPAFPQAEWELLRRQRTADIERKRKDPEWVAGHVFDRILFGDRYRGRTPTKESYAAITTDEMRAWWAANLRPDRAVLLAGGDVALDTLVPKLEARLGAWTASALGAGATADVPLPAGETGAPIHFVDRPGAAQSILRVGGYVSDPGSPDWFPLILGNQVVGGQFTARINMNLREAKGYTYGARSGLSYDLAGGRFVASAGVHTEKTGLALVELLSEIAGPAGPRPLTGVELEDARASIVYAWPLRFESPDYLLNQEEAVWRYGLPADWIAGYVERLRGVGLEAAGAAWTGRIDPARLTIVVVGDGAKVREGLRALGRPILEHDVDGAPIAAP